MIYNDRSNFNRNGWRQGKGSMEPMLYPSLFLMQHNGWQSSFQICDWSVIIYELHYSPHWMSHGPFLLKAVKGIAISQIWWILRAWSFVGNSIFEGCLPWMLQCFVSLWPRSWHQIVKKVPLSHNEESLAMMVTIIAIKQDYNEIDLSGRRKSSFVI